MSADGIAAPMDADRSTESANNSSPLELQLTDPNGHPTQCSSTNHRARADVQVRIHQEGAKLGLDLLVDATGARRAPAAGVQRNGTSAA